MTLAHNRLSRFSIIVPFVFRLSFNLNTNGMCVAGQTRKRSAAPAGILAHRS
jgi:hypothetical protein